MLVRPLISKKIRRGGKGNDSMTAKKVDLGEFFDRQIAKSCGVLRLGLWGKDL